MAKEAVSQRLDPHYLKGTITEPPEYGPDDSTSPHLGAKTTFFIDITTTGVGDPLKVISRSPLAARARSLQVGDKVIAFGRLDTRWRHDDEGYLKITRPPVLHASYIQLISS